MSWTIYAQPLTEYPSRLYDDSAAKAVRRQPALMAALMFICLLPRAWVAWKQESICPDAVQYLQIAEALRAGDFGYAFDYLNLNIYPAILLALRYVGVDWVLACGAWSLLMATLAVLPLYGLVCRQFDQRAAIVACLLYALHPRLVLYSPLILRDPTFWFLFLLSLYLTWRAVTEYRWWLFLTAGVSIFLAIHTRTEGWLLVLPMAAWVGCRLWAAAGGRIRLLWGILACLAVIPLATILINVTLLRQQSEWHVACTRNFQYAWQWLSESRQPATPSGQPAGAEAAGGVVASADSNPAPGHKVLHRLVVRFTKTFTYVYGLLVLAGIWSLRRHLLRTDTLPYFLIATAAFTGIWIRYNVLPIDERYFFTILLASLPGLSLGVLQVAEWTAKLAGWLRAAPGAARPAAVLGLLAVVGLSGLIDGGRVGGSMFRAWQQQADLGKWISRSCGPRQNIAANIDEIRLVVYYADGQLVRVDDELHCYPPAAECGQAALPDVMALWQDTWRRDGWALAQKFVAQQASLGYQQVPPEQLPPSCQPLLVLVRHRDPAAAACSPTAPSPSLAVRQ